MLLTPQSIRWQYTHGVPELFSTFWPNRQLNSKWYDNYAVCTLAARPDG